MKKSYWFLHIAVLLAGFTGILGKLITLNEGLLTWYRILISSIILFFVIRWFKIAKPDSLAKKIDIAKVGMIITIHWIFFYASIKYANVSIGVVCYCLTSFFTAVFKPIIERKKFQLSELFLSTLTVVGISLIFHFETTYQVGILLGVISSAFAALYTIYNERLVKKYDSRVIMYYQMLGGTTGWSILLPLYLYLFPSRQLIPDLTDSIYLVILALFCTVGLYTLFAEALKKIPAFTVNLSFNLEPIYAIGLAFVFFDEAREVNHSFYAGLTIVIISVILQSIMAVKSSLAAKTAKA